MIDLDAYLARVGLDRAGDLSLEALHRAHVTHIPYENLDVRLGREIRLDTDSVFDKLVRRRRGGYCFEMNALYAAVLEALGHTVTRYLGRVRLGDPVSPRPATHMVLRVDDLVIDVGFGSAVPLGPIPLGGQATYGAWTWTCRPTVTPEGDDAWLVSLFDALPMFTFVEQPAHPIDYVTPNHFTSTHPLAIFTQCTMAQRWRDDVQLGLVDRVLKERRPDGTEHDTEIDPADLGPVLRDHFGLDLTAQDLGALRHLLGG